MSPPNNVIIPADEAHLLLPSIAYGEEYTGEPVACGWHKPARSFVVHTANIDPTTCETCNGRKNIIEWFDNNRGGKSPTYGPRHDCHGSGTVPPVVTLAVPCETCDGLGTVDLSWEDYKAAGIEDGDDIPGTDDCDDCEGEGHSPVGTATVLRSLEIFPFLDPVVAGMWNIVEMRGSRVMLLPDFSPGPGNDIDITDQVVNVAAVGHGAFMLELANVKATT